MVDDIHVRTDPAGNIKPDKQESTEKIGGVVATIMALDRAIRNGSAPGSGRVYDERGCWCSSELPIYLSSMHSFVEEILCAP